MDKVKTKYFIEMVKKISPEDIQKSADRIKKQAEIYREKELKSRITNEFLNRTYNL